MSSRRVRDIKTDWPTDSRSKIKLKLIKLTLTLGEFNSNPLFKLLEIVKLLLEAIRKSLLKPWES
jgi:hypothetical protein